VRREVWNAACKNGQTALARELKGARSALWKNPGDLTARQRAKLAWIAQVNGRRYRAYPLKEALRLVFTLKGVRATVLGQAWLAWARRCPIPAFVELAKAIARHRADLQAALTEGLSGGRVEAVNTKIRLLTRVAFGFKSPEALLALALLSLGGLCPSLPGRG
jgi:transposase